MAKVSAMLIGGVAAIVLYSAILLRKHEVEQPWAPLSAASCGDVGDT